MHYQTGDGIIWKAEYRPCPICKSDRFLKIGPRGGRSHRTGKGVETDVVRCKDCDIIYTYPTLFPETNPYDTESPEEYFQRHISEKKVLAGESLADYAESLLGRTGRMLELGCGRGENLIGAMNRGWDVFGIEMTRGFADVARTSGITVDQSPIVSSPYLNDKYDVVLLAAVLEHLYDPIDTLQKVSSALNSGGLIFIDVPNESSLAITVGNLYMKLRGDKWAVNLSPTFPPFHVIGFTPASLKAVLTRSGFECISFSVLKWANDVPNGNSIKEKLERTAFGLIQTVGAGIGMGDGISCWAVKL